MVEFRRKQNDNLLILGAVLLLILSGNIVFWSSGVKDKGGSITQALSLKIIGKANLIIDFGNGVKRAFEGDIVGNETIIDVLNQSARAGNFSYKLNEKSDLVSIGELVNDSKKSWRWYLNGKRINKKPNELTTKSGDKILIKYE